MPPRPLRPEPSTALVLADTTRRTDRLALVAGVLTTAGGLFGLLAASAFAVPALAVGVPLMGVGMDARLSWRWRPAVGIGVAYGVMIAMVAGFLGASVAVAGVIPLAASVAGAHAVVLRRSDRRLIRRLLLLRNDGPRLEALVDRIIRIPRPVVFDAAAILANWGRFDLLERVATQAVIPYNDSLRRFHLALARVGRGDADGALAIADAADHTANGPLVKEEWNQLVARIRIAKGEASEVLVSFDRVCSVAHPVLEANRLLVIADAQAAVGNVGSARELVLAVCATHGRVVLERLKAGRRPTAAIAADLLATAAPYR